MKSAKSWMGLPTVMGIVFLAGLATESAWAEIAAETVRSGSNGLRSIKISDSATHLADEAFVGRADLGSVDLGDGIETIGSRAFLGCKNLTNVVFGKNVAIIGDWAFAGCSRLREIELPDSVKEIGGWAFASTNLSKVSLGNGLEIIRTMAFGGSLKSITLPASVRIIEYAPFKAEDIWFLGPPPEVPDADAFDGLSFFARGHYTAAHAALWEAAIDRKGMWKRLRMFNDGDHPVPRPSQPRLSPGRVEIPQGYHYPAIEYLKLVSKLSPRFPAEIREAAQKGDAEAQGSIATAYYFGRGIEKDLSQALGWFHRAAEQGNVQAQYNLGLMLQNGEGVSPRSAEGALLTGVFWTRLAAEEGEPQAQRALGFLFITGKGVSQDVELGELWLRAAAEQGDQVAARALDAIRQARKP